MNGEREQRKGKRKNTKITNVVSLQSQLVNSEEHNNLEGIMVLESCINQGIRFKDKSQIKIK